LNILKLFGGTHSNSHGYANEQHEDREVDLYHSWLVLEFIVQSNRNGASHTKRNNHADNSNIESNLPVAQQKAQIYLQADDEEKQRKSKIGDEVQIGHRLGWKDGLCKPWDAAEDRRTKEDTADNL
jgi:L-rhamnose isomerase